jgi:uncharacterized membrane protein
MTEPSMPPPPPSPPPAAADDSNRTVMLILSYIPILNFIPLIVQQTDPEVKWHAKHGLVLFVAEFAVGMVFGIFTMIPVIGCIVPIIAAIFFLGVLVVHVLCIMKAINGERFVIPFLTDFVAKLNF